MQGSWHRGRSGSCLSGATLGFSLQGVQSVGPGGRPRVNVTWHPDTTFSGARANIMRALNLEEAADTGGRPISSMAESGLGKHLAGALTSVGSGGLEPVAALPAAYGAAHGGLTGDAPGARVPEPATAAEAAADPKQPKRKKKQEEGSGDNNGADGDKKEGAEEEEGEDHCCASDRTSDLEGGGAKEDPDGTGEAAMLHRRSATKSEFVASWVRTLTKQGSIAVGASAAPSRQVSRQVSSSSARKAGPRAAATVSGMDLLPVPEVDEDSATGGEEAPGRQGSKLAARARSQRSGTLGLLEGDSAERGRGSAMAVSHQGESPVGGEGGRKGKGKGDVGSDDGEDKQSDKGSESEIGSEAGSQAASALSGGWRAGTGSYAVWAGHNPAAATCQCCQGSMQECLRRCPGMSRVPYAGASVTRPAAQHTACTLVTRPLCHVANATIVVVRQTCMQPPPIPAPQLMWWWTLGAVGCSRR